jgi:hypothetical protein
MAARSFVIVAVVAGAVTGPVASAASAPAPATASVQAHAMSRPAERTASADAIDLQVTRNGSLAMTLTWSGGSGPYDVLIDPTTGAGRFESDVDAGLLFRGLRGGRGRDRAAGVRVAAVGRTTCDRSE